MAYTAHQIAGILNGEIEGDPDIQIEGFSKIEEGKAGTLSFISNPKYSKYIYSTNASIVLVSRNFQTDNGITTTLIRVDDAYQAFAKLLMLQDSSEIKRNGISSKATVEKGAQIGQDVLIDDFVYVGENAVIEDHVKILPHTFIGDHVHIGKETMLHPGIRIYNNCVVGQKCVIHAGVVIGSDGFGFAPQGDSIYQKVPQIGNVVIEDNVEIGSNTCIDRATIGSTIIRKGVKLDNLIQVAHNCEIGENTVIAAQAGIAGSTKIGKDCMIGGQAGFIGHLEIADRVKVAAQSGITSSIKKPGQIIQGAPAFDFNRYQKSYVMFRKLPELYDKINQLEKRLAHFHSENNND